MSSQASVQSIEALKDLRVALAFFAQDALAALGSVDMEVRRTIMWLQNERRMYWTEQIKRRREKVSSARAEVFRRKLSKASDSEQKEILARAEASLRDAELRITLVRKWDKALQLAYQEYRGTTRRISSMASGDVPRALVLLEKMIEALEAYVREAPPTGFATSSPAPYTAFAEKFLSEEPAPGSDSEPEPVEITTGSAEEVDEPSRAPEEIDGEVPPHPAP